MATRRRCFREDSVSECHSFADAKGLANAKGLATTGSIASHEGDTCTAGHTFAKDRTFAKGHTRIEGNTRTKAFAGDEARADPGRDENALMISERGHPVRLSEKREHDLEMSLGLG